MQERSYLFVPGDRPERFDKALASGAHGVILDLEDAVHPERKSQAREAVRCWLAQTTSPVWVRINPDHTPWHADDCKLLAQPMIRGLMVPKAEDPLSLAALAGQLRVDQKLIPLIETVAGWFAAQNLAQVPQVQRLAFGSVDFMSDSGIQGEGDEMNSVRTQLVLVSRRAAIQAPIDGISLAIEDTAQLTADVLRSRRFGFGAKLCIHPRQVPTVHQCFSPTEEEIAWAERVVAALQSSTSGAVTVDGKMVDKPVALLAQAILDAACTKQ